MELAALKKELVEQEGALGVYHEEKTSLVLTPTSTTSGPGGASTARRAPCRHFVKLGGYCSFGDDCKFSHDMPVVLSLEDAPFEAPRPVRESERRRAAWLLRRASDPAREQAADSPRDADSDANNLACDATGWRRGAPRVRNGSRAAAFCRWLLAVYGEDALKAAGGVVDVAGGRGELAFQLHTLRGIKTTVLDPRPVQLQKPLARAHHGAHMRTTPLHSAPLTASSADAAQKGARPLALQLQHCEAADDGAAGNAADTIDQEQDSDVKAAALHLHLPTGITACFPAPVPDAAHARYYHHYLRDVQRHQAPLAAASLSREVDQALHACSVLVGLHPDQATEPVVDWALQHGKPFAVVPCCVFPKMFPTRALDVQLQHSVSTHRGFVEYLLAKDARLRCTELDFEGRNLVVYLPPA